MDIVNELILYAGLGLFFLGAVGMIMTAFRTSAFWGLGIILIPPALLIYAYAHWQDAKGPLKIQVVGLLIIGAFAYMNGGISAVTSVSSHISNSAPLQAESAPNGQPSSASIAPLAPAVHSAPSRINQPSANVNTPARATPIAPVAQVRQVSQVTNQPYKCDGRQHCSQMKSCAEATYFLKNCPNTKMDGDRNGIPCESQWCTSGTKANSSTFRSRRP